MKKIWMLAAAVGMTACASPAAFAQQGGATLDVRGTISATLRGVEREWVTISGDVRGEPIGSAFWGVQGAGEMPDLAEAMASMGGQMSEAERAQMEAMASMMADGNGPMAGMLGQMGGGTAAGGTGRVDLTISGHDPASPNILFEQVLVIVVEDIDQDQAAALKGRTVPARVMFYDEYTSGTMADVFYVAGDGVGDASVVFDALELQSGGGQATGSFSASMCRMEAARMMEGPDLDNCLAVEGRFDTTLDEETSSGS